MVNRQFRIDSAQDPRIQDFVSLTDMDLRLRSEEPAGIFIAEGFLVLERVVRARLSIRTILTDHKRLDRVMRLLSEIPEAQRPDIAIASAQVLEEITGFRVHRGVLGSVTRPLGRSIDEVIDRGGSIMVLEGLVDPTNVGLAFRSAAAMGYSGALVSSDCVDPLYRRSVRTSMGAVIDLPWACDPSWPQSLSTLTQRGISVLALSPDPQCRDLDDVLPTLTGPLAMVFGTEGAGLREDTRSLIGACARIPMAGDIDSLNIAACVAVVGHALRMHAPHNVK
jgi:tRNA G18 (ribose-2'-O)-methylase SpoU